MVLGFEVGEAADLARSGLSLLANLLFLEQHAAVLTLWSIAAEKMLKLSTGLMELEDGRDWPSVEVMRRWGHDVGRLNMEVASRYRKRLTSSSAHQKVGRVLDDCDADQVLQLLLEALSRWGQQGRFDRLDTMAGKPSRGVTAEELWEKAERQIVDMQPAMADKLPDWEAFRSDLNGVINESLDRWWHINVAAWRDGLAGFEAQQHYEVLDLAPWT
jgi:hypothetical protein